MSEQSTCGGCTSCASDSKHGCGACCGKEILLCAEEISILSSLAQLAFLPIAYDKSNPSTPYHSISHDDGIPVPLFSQVIQSLAFKGFITIDPNIPLKNVDYKAHFPIGDMEHGSIALTSQGQALLDFLEISINNF